jgi:hypothetical protein
MASFCKIPRGGLRGLDARDIQLRKNGEAGLPNAVKAREGGLRFTVSFPSLTPGVIDVTIVHDGIAGEAWV